MEARVILGRHLDASATKVRMKPGNSVAFATSSDGEASFGNLLPHAHQNAGTPDFKSGLSSCFHADVDAFFPCCQDCPELCGLYTGCARNDYQGARCDNRAREMVPH